MPLLDLDKQSGSIRIDFNGVGVLNPKAITEDTSHFQVKTSIVQVPEKPKEKGKFSTSGEEGHPDELTPNSQSHLIGKNEAESDRKKKVLECDE
jgi:hypothetical protein